jgi:hypothetical protein
MDAAYQYPGIILSLQIFTREEAAKYLTKRWGLGLTRGTLDYLASHDKGPKFHFHNKTAFYHKEDLDSWILNPNAARFRRKIAAQ